MKRMLFFGLTGLMMMIHFSSCEDKTPGNTFKVRMTDAPGDYTALNMVILSVDAYLQDEGWVNLSSEAQAVNILSLTDGAEITLADKTHVEAGLYTHLRIRFASTAVLTMLGSGPGEQGSSVLVNWDGSQEVDILINEEVSADMGANVLIDFNVAESIVEQGEECFIHPVIVEVDNEYIYTGIEGEIAGPLAAAIVLSNGDHTFSTYISASGSFLIRGVNPGNYTLTIIPCGGQPMYFHNIVIVQGEIYQMGIIQF